MTPSPSHVVLGGNGVVGRETLIALRDRGENVASFARTAATVPGVRSLTGDLRERATVDRALAGAEVAYLTAGIPYSIREWTKQWPVIVRNSIDSAIENDTHLVYFDNVYAYGRVDGAMTERSAISPDSKKGEVRAAAVRELHAAVGRGLKLTIARSADFYGPGAGTSVFNSFALDKLAVGKPATWLFDADLPHSLSFTPDIGRALAALGTVETPSGLTWHVPTAPALSGREYVELASPGARNSVMSATTMRVGALFNSAARETFELAYQYTAPYVFDSSAFETHFGLGPTPIADGIAATLGAVRAG